jgi:long-subunit fatty acid transport protein
MDYRMMSSYIENSTDANPIGFELRNALSTSGAGVNVKIGAILRPFSSLRFGFALHSPTYYYLTDAYGSRMISSGVDDGYDIRIDEDNSSYELTTPGKIMYSLAYFFGKKGIISMDWDIIDYRETQLKNESGFPWDDKNDDIYNHMRVAKNVRIGGEYRLTDNVSLRAGTAWYQSAYRKDMTASNPMIWTAGTTPHYSFDTGSRYFSGGIGYRTGSFFLDAALMSQTNSENFFNFFDSVDQIGGVDRTDDKYASVNTRKITFLFSTGFRF